MLSIVSAMVLVVWVLLVVGAAIVEWQYQRAWKKIADAGNPADVGYTRVLFLLCWLFEREQARWRMRICEAKLPSMVRAPILRLVAVCLGADLSEIRKPLDLYPTIGDFFSRELRDGARSIDAAPDTVLSPADATVLSIGSVNDPKNTRVAQVEVKGTTFSLPGLLGIDPTKTLAADRKIMYMALHLGPGDYHRFHSPTQFTIFSGRRFAGEGLPVSPVVTGRTNDVFSVNERIVLSGEWSGGQMHLAAVGAAHVRGIFLSFDEQFAKDMAPSEGMYYLDGCQTCTQVPKGSGGLHNAPGSSLGGFRLGSAVVLVFEAPAGSTWRVGPGDRVRVGQQLLAAQT
mmetsp:Transcript_53944/g.106433  ORF Transcript_53944/g.106433 Transcript_53944/m.106433 type:complete len:343 (+) Transcript_53944:54-1082(+)